MKLNDEQRQQVTDNHNLIYGIMNKYHLSNDYYDVLAYGLCKASYLFNPSKGKFTTFAYRIMRDELFMDFRKNNKVPLNNVVNNKYDCSIEEFDHTWINMDNLSELEKKVVKLKYDGYNQSEIAEMVGEVQPVISRMLKDIRKKIQLEG